METRKTQAWSKRIGGRPDRWDCLSGKREIPVRSSQRSDSKPGGCWKGSVCSGPGIRRSDARVRNLFWDHEYFLEAAEKLERDHQRSSMGGIRPHSDLYRRS